jgi:regulator of nonsense transcripts 2
MPHLPEASHKADSIGLSTGDRLRFDDTDGMSVGRGSQWEDEEERKFYEDLIDLKDWVPRSFLNIPEGEAVVAETTELEDAEAESADIERLMDATEDADDDTEYGQEWS